MRDLQPLLSFSHFISVFPPVTKPSVLQKTLDWTRAGELCLNPSKCPLTSHALAEAFTGQRPASSNSVSPPLKPSLRPSVSPRLCLNLFRLSSETSTRFGLDFISCHHIENMWPVNAQKGIWRGEDGRQRRGIIDLPQTSEEQRSIFPRSLKGK